MTAWRPSSQQIFCESPRTARGRLRGSGGGAKRCLAGQSGDGQSEGAVLHANRTLNGRRRDNRQTTRKTIVYKSNPMIWLQIGQIGTSAFRQDTLSEVIISLGNHMKSEESSETNEFPRFTSAQRACFNMSVSESAMSVSIREEFLHCVTPANEILVAWWQKHKSICSPLPQVSYAIK